jgi:hypothetical protein
LTPYLSLEMVIARFGVSDHHFPPLDSLGNESQDSTQLTLSETPCLLSSFPSQTRPISAVSMLATEKSICRLRLDLIEMLRLSLHAVDYATKGYALGLVEFALQSSSGRKKLEYLGQTIVAASHELYEAELDDSQQDFIESARAISAALSSTCQHANEISSHTVALLREGIRLRSKEAVQLCGRADRLLRLCIVVFMKQRVEYAEAVLRDVDEWKHDLQERPTGLADDASAVMTSDARERSIAASLAQIMENLCSIAVASLLPHRIHC